MPYIQGQTDYDRACATTAYTETLSLPAGTALVFGGEPMNTVVLKRGGLTFIVRVMYCNASFDPDVALKTLDLRLFAEPNESVPFEVATSPLKIFDSAYPGDDTIQSQTFSIDPGRYVVLTRIQRMPGEYVVFHMFKPTT